MLQAARDGHVHALDEVLNTGIIDVNYACRRSDDYDYDVIVVFEKIFILIFVLTILRKGYGVKVLPSIFLKSNINLSVTKKVKVTVRQKCEQSHQFFFQKHGTATHGHAHTTRKGYGVMRGKMQKKKKKLKKQLLWKNPWMSNVKNKLWKGFP